MAFLKGKNRILMLNYIVFGILVICVLFLLKYLFKTRNDSIPDMPDPNQDSIFKYPD